MWAVTWHHWLSVLTEIDKWPLRLEKRRILKKTLLVPCKCMLINFVECTIFLLTKVPIYRCIVIRNCINAVDLSALNHFRDSGCFFLEMMMEWRDVFFKSWSLIICSINVTNGQISCDRRRFPPANYFSSRIRLLRWSSIIF